MSGGKWLKILCILTLIPMGWHPVQTVAQTASCLAEAEPNNDPAAALALPGVEGCVEGTTSGEDQDFAAWTLTESDAARRWTFTMSAIPGQAVVIRIATVVFAADGVTVESYQDIANVTGDATQPATLADLFLPANTYYIGVVASGEGEYNLTVAAGTPLPE